MALADWQEYCLAGIEWTGNFSSLDKDSICIDRSSISGSSKSFSCPMSSSMTAFRRALSPLSANIGLAVTCTPHHHHLHLHHAGASIVCYSCDGVGHIGRNCYSKGKGQRAEPDGANQVRSGNADKAKSKSNVFNLKLAHIKHQELEPCKQEPHAVSASNAQAKEHEWDDLDMVFPGVLMGVRCQVLLGSGATGSLVDATFAKADGFRITPCSNHVEVANGRELTSHGIVMPHLKLGDITACVRLVVMDLANGIDVIMGNAKH